MTHGSNVTYPRGRPFDLLTSVLLQTYNPVQYDFISNAILVHRKVSDP